MAGFRDLVGRAWKAGLDLLRREAGGRPGDARAGSGGGRAGSGGGRAGSGGGGVRTVRADERAREIAYAPDPDGAADPGEIVWTWVPYEEDPAQGKDRPVLVVARARGDELLGLMLSSQAHRRDDANWIGIGSGAWDRQGRESSVRLDRVLEIPEHGIRREGAVVPPERFERVAAALRSGYGWR